MSWPATPLAPTAPPQSLGPLPASPPSGATNASGRPCASQTLVSRQHSVLSLNIFPLPCIALAVHAPCLGHASRRLTTSLPCSARLHRSAGLCDRPRCGEAGGVAPLRRAAALRQWPRQYRRRRGGACRSHGWVCAASSIPVGQQYSPPRSVPFLFPMRLPAYLPSLTESTQAPRCRWCLQSCSTCQGSRSTTRATTFGLWHLWQRHGAQWQRRGLLHVVAAPPSWRPSRSWRPSSTSWLPAARACR